HVFLLCDRIITQSTTYISTLSLHDALPILHDSVDRKLFKDANKAWDNLYVWMNKVQLSTEIQKEIIHILKYISYKGGKNKGKLRSEEHTSELQSRFDLVCRLLLEKKTHKHL